MPLTHLDALYYDEHWTPLPEDDFAAQQEKPVTGDRWIVEGTTPARCPSGSPPPTHRVRDGTGPVQRLPSTH